MTAKQWTVLDLITWTTGYFRQKGLASPRLDAELLLAHSLACTRIQLYMESDKPLLDPELQQFKALARERVEGKSVAHIVGKRDFWRLPFKTPVGVFVPRPETEGLIEFSVSHLSKETPGPLLDLCSGSGNIPVSLAMEFPAARVTGVEVTELGARTARENATTANVSQRVSIVQSDALDFLAKTQERYPLVTSNPPYVPEAEWATLDRAIRLFEPKGALTSGADGLDLLRLLIPAVFHTLLPGGWFAFEYSGPSQTPALQRLMQATGYQNVQVLKDLAGIDRILVGCSPL